MRAGPLRQRLVFQAKTRTTDGRGGATVAWATLATRWGSMEAFGARENETGGRLESGVTHEARTRSDSVTRTVTAAHRIAWDGRTFQIVGRRDMTGRKREIVFECREAEA